ncbi:beta family protein [Lentzea kentuckyensis]|uniref:beta family protein n=1 Tax=Lentzea kentuckyensis TaxID=360086 RepID=UPI000A3B3D35|nr:hypothetical protein [Lentzea kentuckyensis]
MIEVLELATLRTDMAMSFRPLVVVKSRMGEFEALRHLVDRGVATPRILVELLDSIQWEDRGQLLQALVKAATQMAARQQPRAGEAFGELAGELVARPEFAGSNFSWGDGELARCRSGRGRAASSVSRWVAYATSHHLEHVAQRGTSGL